MAASIQQDPQHQQEMRKNVKADPSAELTDPDMVSRKGGTASDVTSCVSSADAAGSLKEGDLENESLSADKGTPYQVGGYYGYYYPGYDYAGGDGFEFPYPVVQADDGSLMYLVPGVQPGYSAYCPYVPVTTIGGDGHYIAQQPYSPIFQPPFSSPGCIQTPLSYGELMQSPYAWDPCFFVGDGASGHSYYGVPEISGSKPSTNHPHSFSKAFRPSDFTNPLEIKNSSPAAHGMRNQLKPSSKVSQHGSTFKSDVFGKGYIPFVKFNSYNQGKGGRLHTANPENLKATAQGWGGVEKFKPRTKATSTGSLNSIDEQSHVPRTANAKGALMSGGNADGKGNSNSITYLIGKAQYNLPDFPIKYDHAFFFVIKSYSEDDIHKSIKYNVWASTPNGNKRLDNAYQDAEQKMAEKGSKCPVFLFFSVNASGQFCGVAEMIGRVDFNKNMDFWQQDKWSGYFPVRWHIIKDIPNPQLRHIILENNDNKPVTNSRDTQEVKSSLGIEMLNIFKNYDLKTSILDDFDFYESRQKVMQEKKMRPAMSYFDPVKKVDGLTTSFQSIDLSDTKTVDAIPDGVKPKE